MKLNSAKLNRIILLLFAPILILAGIGGFLLPAGPGMVSAEPAYNIFHIIAGSAGLLLALSRNVRSVPLFNIIFGLIDLYQLLASRLHLFPEQWFRWTSGDDLIHLIVGLMLVAAGSLFFRSAT